MICVALSGLGARVVLFGPRDCVVSFLLFRSPGVFGDRNGVLLYGPSLDAEADLCEGSFFSLAK